MKYKNEITSAGAMVVPKSSQKETITAIEKAGFTVTRVSVILCKAVIQAQVTAEKMEEFSELAEKIYNDLKN